VIAFVAVVIMVAGCMGVSPADIVAAFAWFEATAATKDRTGRTTSYDPLSASTT